MVGAPGDNEVPAIRQLLLRVKSSLAIRQPSSVRYALIAGESAVDALSSRAARCFPVESIRHHEYCPYRNLQRAARFSRQIQLYTLHKTYEPTILFCGTLDNRTNS
jgi:hypothetical protein